MTNADAGAHSQEGVCCPTCSRCQLGPVSIRLSPPSLGPRIHLRAVDLHIESGCGAILESGEAPPSQSHHEGLPTASSHSNRPGKPLVDVPRLHRALPISNGVPGSQYRDAGSPAALKHWSSRWRLSSIRRALSIFMPVAAAAESEPARRIDSAAFRPGPASEMSSPGSETARQGPPGTAPCEASSRQWAEADRQSRVNPVAHPSDRSRCQGLQADTWP